MRKLTKIFGTAVLVSFAAACHEGDGVNQLKSLDDSPLLMELPADAAGRKAAANVPFALYSAEYITSAESGQIGRIIFFKDVGNKQLGSDFVSGTSVDGTDAISYYIDETRASNDLNPAVTSAAIARAMQTWDGITCSTLAIHQVPSNRRTDTGFVSELFGFGGSFDFVADVVHAGWLGADFFDMVAPEGSTFILGVTFTIIFTDDNGNPTDIDRNGKLDVAWREIYYNDTFSWADGNHFDVETIALHESGHGLSQGHFGQAFLDAGSGQLHFSPLAVMNAAYSGIQTQIKETDKAGHCSNWSEWMN